MAYIFGTITSHWVIVDNAGMLRGFLYLYDNGMACIDLYWDYYGNPILTPKPQYFRDIHRAEKVIFEAGMDYIEHDNR